MRMQPLVVEAGGDSLIPLITTVAAHGDTADALAYLQRQRDRRAEGIGYSFCIATKDADCAVGQIGLWTQNIAEGRATTGYWIAESARGHGYARAALQCLSAWALAFPDIARLELHVEPHNEASWRVAESCGFTREGLLRSWQQVGPTRRDMYVYSLIRP